MNTCMTCKKEFDGKEWMNQCWECHRSFKGMKRISPIQRQNGVLIMSHPDVTEEEVNEWIKKTYGSVHTPENWGAAEVKKAKIWWNCQNTD